MGVLVAKYTMIHPIEATGNNIIESAINLLNRIAETYDDATANELERRFLNSIRTGDPRKFKRVMSKVMEPKMKMSDLLNEASKRKKYWQR